MGEKLIVVKDLTVNYEGYFDSQGLYRLIDRFAMERGYDKNDTLHEVKVKEDGKYIKLDMRPEKTISDHIKFVIRTIIDIEKLTKETITVDGKEIKTNKGKVSIKFVGIVKSDYEGRWKSHPGLVFLKTIMDKYVYGTYDKDYKNMIKKDVFLLKNEISSYLNIHKYTSSEQHH